MGRADYLKLGSHNKICDRCGRKYKAEETTLEWTGLRVCKRKCYEPRHPQEFLKGRKDDPSVRDARPDPVAGRCGPSNVVGQAVVGCAIVGWFDDYKSPL
jgi:hypothetical protein